MTSRVSVILLIGLGATSIDCVQDAGWSSGRPGDRAAGPLARAGAQLAPGESADGDSGPTLLFDQSVSPTAQPGLLCLSPEIDLTGYRTVVVHRPFNDNRIEVKLGDGAGFVSLLAPGGTNTNVVTVDTRLGRLMRFSWGASLAGVCATRAFTVAGYRDGGGVITPPPSTAALGGTDP